MLLKLEVSVNRLCFPLLQYPCTCFAFGIRHWIMRLPHGLSGGSKLSHSPAGCLSSLVRDFFGGYKGEIMLRTLFSFVSLYDTMLCIVLT